MKLREFLLECVQDGAFQKRTQAGLIDHATHAAARASSLGMDASSRAEQPSRAEQYLLEALSLPEVCFLEHCEDDHRRAVLQGRVSAMARDELESERETVENSLNLDGIDFDSATPLERETCTPTLDDDECEELPLPPGLGLVRRQPSFKPAFMLTDEEQQSVRSRRRACVLQLARSVMGRTASKISKCPRRWHSSSGRSGQAESGSARPEEPRVGSPRGFSAPEEQASRTLGRPSCSLFSLARGKQKHEPATSLSERTHQATSGT